MSMHEETEAAEGPVEMQLRALTENRRLKRALDQAQTSRRELGELIEQITAAPWYPALFQRLVDTPMGQRALVWTAGTPRLVNLHPDVAAGSLCTGEAVYLDHELATLMARAHGGFVAPADSAHFDRIAPDGRVVVRARDDEFVLENAASLDPQQLRAGQTVLFDRASRIALEAMEGIEGEQYQLDDVAGFSRTDVGGRDESLEDLIGVLTASLIEPELASAYELDGRRAVLLYGPPGCGKTLMAKTAAAEVQRISGKRCRFAVVKPGEFEGSYVGETEANIRNCFRALREAAGDDLAVLFLDEIESIGRIRGGAGGRHGDRFLAALLAEIDGFCERGQVSLLAATNRRDLLDPALLSRLSDTQISVPRPDQWAAREIFEIHLSESLLYADGKGRPARAVESRVAAEVRGELLETAVSRLYAPNAGTEVSRLALRDGSSRTVHARELMSGRLIEQLARSTRQKALRRHIRGEGQGLRTDDVVEAVEHSLDELSTTLSIHNARAYIDDLPQDVDVVQVDAIRPQPARRHRYYNAA